MTFALERFAWTPGALEVSGRWTADAPRRFRHVRLVVMEDGRPRRLAPVTATPMRATPEGHPWSATFAWAGNEAPAQPVLEAGHDLLVELPAPDRVAVAVAVAVAPEDFSAERAALMDEWARAKTARVQLDAERAELAQARSELEAARKSIEGERERVAAELKAARAKPAPAEPAPAPVVTAERAPVPPMNGTGPRHAALQHALELPRQPDDHQRGAAPLPIRIVAIALASGIVIALALILAAIF
jgi:hypothetical protein